MKISQHLTKLEAKIWWYLLSDSVYVCMYRAGVQSTLDPYAEAFI